MGCFPCMHKVDKEKKRDLIIDVEKVLADTTWEKFKESHDR